VADSLFPGFGTIALLVIAFGLIAVMVLNMYGGSLTLISSIDSLRKVRPTLAVRISPPYWQEARERAKKTHFQELPASGLYFFIPWTAVKPHRLLHRSAGPLRDRGDLQAQRYLWSLGLGRNCVITSLPSRA
jgi:hypothetical protein